MLYLGDCKDLISTLDKGSVDLMVTDPPYDHTGCRGGGFIGCEIDSGYFHTAEERIELAKASRHEWF